MTTVLALLVGVLVVLAITAATGYFVAQEFSYMAVDRSRLTARAASGDKAAQRALAVTRRTSFMLSGAQLGITVTALLVGYVAEPLIGESLGTILGGAGVPVGVALAVGTVLALLFSTFVQMLFGELFPKNLAIARPEPVALRLAASTTLYLTVFGWLIAVFDRAANLLLRVVRIEPVHDVEHAATARDLGHIVSDSRLSGDLSPDLSLLLDRILDFPERDVEHAMVPRSRADVVRAEDSVADLWDAMGAGHSRYPVLDSGDRVVGIAHLQDVLSRGSTDQAPVSSLMREPVLVPTSMTLPTVLEKLVGAGTEMACVLDEYGGFVGVLTVEDLAEELLGEITDEHDTEEPFLDVGPEDRTMVVPGDLPVDEVERAVRHDLPRGDYETVAGLVIARHGAFPEQGQVVTIEVVDPALDEDEEHARVLIEVLEVENHVPSLVRITVDEPPLDPAAQVAEEPGANDPGGDR